MKRLEIEKMGMYRRNRHVCAFCGREDVPDSGKLRRHIYACPECAREAFGKVIFDLGSGRVYKDVSTDGRARFERID